MSGTFTESVVEDTALGWFDALRERFHLGEGKAAIAAQVISATSEGGLIRADESVGATRKRARCLPS